MTMRTGDRARVRMRDRMQFYTTEKLGPKQSVTPEGFLLCESVPIARTGTQLYGADEIPLDPLPNGEVRIERSPDEVFDEETIASFEGKPVTIDHPDEFVTPDNWKALAVGVTQNVRRGDGTEDDLLLADLLITDKQAIEAVRKGLREVSCGYEADYEQDEPGTGRQLNIIGNHVALVERGRAGPRCSIQDKEKKPMKKRGFWDRLMTAAKAKDAEAVKAEMESMDEELEAEEGKKPDEQKPTGDDALADVMARIEALEAAVAKLGETSDEAEEEEETTDGGDLTEAETAEKADEGTTYTGDALRDVISQAEILAPGISMLTKDSAHKASDVHAFQRRVLNAAMKTEDGKKAIEPLLGKRDMAKMTSDALDVVFAAAAERMREKNNDGAIRGGITTIDFGKAPTISEINAANKAHWAK